MPDYREALAPKPYGFVTFPTKRVELKSPAEQGHHKYCRDRLHGALHLTLEVQTALHVSTGITGLGTDVGSRLPLIKTMTVTNTVTPTPQGKTLGKTLVIQGSSLKGCIRAAYESITNSTLAVITGKYRDRTPPDRLPCRDKTKLCPASRVFGALDWQGLVSFSDAQCTSAQPSIGFMPSLYSPRPDQCREYWVRNRVAGRKFYFNMTGVIDKGENRGIPVQQAGRQYRFKTTIHYKNLLPEELGILLLLLGQDPQSPIALKIGGGKPIGMGTMTATIEAVEHSQDLRDRYRQYDVTQTRLTGQDLTSFIQKQIRVAQNSALLEKDQWQELKTLLKYPGDQAPPPGMY